MSSSGNGKPARNNIVNFTPQKGRENIVFDFYRERTDPIEIYNIIAVEDSLPDASERFGPALDYNFARFHDIGWIVLRHGESNWEQEAELFVRVNGELTEEERQVLDRQITALVGITSFSDGGEWEQAWVKRDRFYEAKPEWHSKQRERKEDVEAFANALRPLREDTEDGK